MSKAAQLISEMNEAKMDSYIEVKDKSGNVIGTYDSERFRKLIGGSRSGFAQDWVKEYNQKQGKENGLTAELVFDIIKKGKRKRF